MRALTIYHSTSQHTVGLIYDTGLAMKVWRKEILTLLALLTTIQACFAAVAGIEKLSEHRAVHDLRGRLTQ